jgi:hypothetical protein
MTVELKRDSRAARPPEANGDESDGGGLGDARQTADRFLRAADDAIDRALSRDSRAFLRSSRQEGGQ